MSRNITLLHRFEDPAHSSDPQLQALVDDLGRLDYAPAPRAQFRDDLRAQLVAIAPRVVSEGESVVPATSAASVTALEPAAKRRSFARPVGIAAACVAVLALGLSGAVWQSRSALPGDSLYGLKRAGEDVRLSLTSGDTDRGKGYLSLASTRVAEARDLLGGQSASESGTGVAHEPSVHTERLIRSTLRSANADVVSGSTLLGAAAFQSHSTASLKIMSLWAQTQLTQLGLLAAQVGQGSHQAILIRRHTLHSVHLVKTAVVYANIVRPQVPHGCGTMDRGKFGPSCRPMATPATVTPAVTPATTVITPASISPTDHVSKQASTTPNPTIKSSGPSSDPTTDVTPSIGPTGSGGPTTAQGPITIGGKHHTSGKSTPLPKVTILPTQVKQSTKTVVPVSTGRCSIRIISIPVKLCPTGS